MNQELIIPDTATCEKAVKNLLSFEEDLGARDWQAWVRLVERMNHSQPTNVTQMRAI